MRVFNASDVFGFLSNFSQDCKADSFTCNDPRPPCSSQKGLDFASLWTITQNYVERCSSTGAWLYEPGVGKSDSSLALTNAACEIIAGKGKTNYPKAEFWSRLTTWKFPLIQLVATSPRPPLGILAETFTVLHLLGDPIGSITDILYKIESCQSRSVVWQAEISPHNLLLRTHSGFTSKQEQDRLWKAFTIITDSYDEWGREVGDEALTALQEGLQNQDARATSLQGLQLSFSDICLTTGGALAADRATRFLPVVIAELLFILVFAVAIYRIKSNGQQEPPTIYMNVEIHSVGFSALYFWLIPAVMMASVVGASQTAEAIPRILERFRKDLSNAKFNIPLPDLGPGNRGSRDRRLYGGIYTWQPLRQDRFTKAQENAKEEHNTVWQRTSLRANLRKHLLNFWPKVYWVMPIFIVTWAIITGMLMSGFVPPTGWSCRSWGQLYFGFGWLGSYLATLACTQYLPQRLWFGVMLCKDFSVTAASVTWIVITQLGYYNKCECYTKWGYAPLALPEQADTKHTLQKGLEIGGNYTNILTIGILVQALLVPALLFWRYHAASRVYLQKDDGTSNLQFLRNRNDSVGRSDGTVAGLFASTRSANATLRDNKDADEAAIEIENVDAPANITQAGQSPTSPLPSPDPAHLDPYVITSTRFATTKTRVGYRRRSSDDRRSEQDTKPST